jgi:hypothetical protein
LFQVALADDFSLSIETKDSFIAGQTGFVNFQISNFKQTETMYQIVLSGSSNVNWVYLEGAADTTSSGISTELVSVPAFSTKSFRIVVQPPVDILPSQPYQYIIKAKDITDITNGETHEGSTQINVIQTTRALIKDLTLNCSECTESVGISGNIYNIGSTSLTLSLVLKAGDKQKTLSIGTVGILDKKPFSASFSLEGMVPGAYDMTASLVDDLGNEYNSQKASFTIPVIANVVYDKKVSSTPFGSSITVTATNTGNVASDVDLRSVSPNNWYSVISGPNPTGMMTGFYYWRTTIGPKQSVSVSYSEIYWPTYVLIIVAVAAFMFIYWQSTAFTFSKRVIGKPAIRSGKDISISLHLKSRRRGIDRVAIRDIVPPSFSIVSNFETVKPLIRKVANGIELLWKMVELTPNEERVLHYTIRPNAELSRKVSLPSALAKATSDRGLTLKHSNRVSLSPGKEPTKIVTVRVAK